MLHHPPQHPSIGVIWAQQQYALQAPTSSHSQSEDRIQFGTLQSLRSATSQYYLWDSQIAHLERTLRDPASHKVYLADGVSPTDAMGYGLMAAGMAKRMGIKVNPMWLLHCDKCCGCSLIWTLDGQLSGIRKANERLLLLQLPTCLGG